LGDWESANQIITATTPTKYTYTVAFTEPSITNSVYVIGYLKSGTVSGTAAGLNIYGGGIYPSHMDIEGVAAGETAADVAADLAAHEADAANPHTVTLQQAVNAGATTTNDIVLSGIGTDLSVGGRQILGSVFLGDIHADAYGASQSGVASGSGYSTIGDGAYGASQHLYNDKGPNSAVIGANARGAMQRGRIDDDATGFATNNGVGAIQLFELTGAESAMTTSGGSASLLLGGGTVSNKNAIVAGDGQTSHGDGSITAGGGFFGVGSGIMVLNGANITVGTITTNALDATADAAYRAESDPLAVHADGSVPMTGTLINQQNLLLGTNSGTRTLHVDVRGAIIAGGNTGSQTNSGDGALIRGFNTGQQTASGRGATIISDNTYSTFGVPYQTASGSGSLIMGRNLSVFGSPGTQIASGSGSQIIGYNQGTQTANNNGSRIIGSNTGTQTSSGVGSTIIAYQTGGSQTASGEGSQIIGWNTGSQTNSGIGAMISGYNAGVQIASGDGATISGKNIGSTQTVSGVGASIGADAQKHPFGNRSAVLIVSGPGSRIYGYNFGADQTVSGAGAMIMGSANNGGSGPFPKGNQTVSGEGAQISGLNNGGTQKASGIGSQIIGQNSGSQTNSGYGARISGNNSGTQTASGYGAQIIGHNDGGTQTASGDGTQISGYNAAGGTQTASGYGIQISGYNSGTQTVAGVGGSIRGFNNQDIQTVSGTGSMLLIDDGSASITGNESIGLGVVTITHYRAIVAGDGLSSSANETITAGGGFWTGTNMLTDSDGHMNKVILNASTNFVPGAGHAALVCYSIGGTNELFALDEDGNVTQLSAHKGNRPVSKSWNVFTGELFVEDKITKTITVTTNYVPRINWDALESDRVAHRQAERGEWDAAKAAWDVRYAEWQAEVAEYPAKLLAYEQAESNRAAVVESNRQALAQYEADLQAWQESPTASEEPEYPELLEMPQPEPRPIDVANLEPEPMKAKPAAYTARSKPGWLISWEAGNTLKEEVRAVREINLAAGAAAGGGVVGAAAGAAAAYAALRRRRKTGTNVA